MDTRLASQAQDLNNCLCANVRKTDRALTRKYDQILSSSGLTASQFALLSVLSEVGALRITDLARVMVMEQTTVTRNIDLLQKAGLVQTSPQTDRRVRAVLMTEQGQRRHAEARVLWSGIQKQMTDALGPQRWRNFLEDLDLVRRVIQSVPGPEGDE